MQTFALFIEQIPFDGPAARPMQRTLPIEAMTETIALKEAADYLESLFEGVTSIRQITAHLQKSDGSVLRQIIFAREEKGGPTTTRS